MAKEDLTVVKIGGNVIDNEKMLEKFLADFSKIKGKKVLVHGGGKLASQMSKRLGIEPKMHNGRRITDKATLEVVTMVYAGWVNKRVAAKLQALEENALGLSGADINAILSAKRPANPIDFGFVGDVEKVNAEGLGKLLDSDFLPVLCAITHDGNGTLLNTNADTIASETAIGLSELYETTLVYCFEKNGVLKDPEDDDSWISTIDTKIYKELLADGTISAGMMPKMENCYHALGKGVKEVKIMHANNLLSISEGSFVGTRIGL
ncbi:acetylglutamate kinase [Flammeovirgaceae bacterium SG7u.111]|nr:acetylglutamate kinase [Flammeovirgaceae bacterium SG7u.132]WPO38570.1 acetylglutamate kinase [Flammeovirgaceae bacterium SG7u.111]